MTGKFEVSAILLLATETKDHVEMGLKFFKSSLPFTQETNGRFFFFVDKDFDYIGKLFVINPHIFLLESFPH